MSADVAAYSDGGGKASAATQVIRGREAVARFFVGLARKLGSSAEVELAEVNGWPSLVFREDGRTTTVLNIETDGAAIFTFLTVRNPDKLARI